LKEVSNGSAFSSALMAAVKKPGVETMSEDMKL
jgi:hypothetical protein